MSTTTISPPKNEEEALQLAAAKACQPDTSFLSNDFREHFRSCSWCFEYARQFREEAPSAISEVGWWSGRAERDIA
jgi:hypothetical protein